MPSRNTWIVKLGGSLLPTAALPTWLAVLDECGPGTRTIVVPGGGEFADAVRVAQRRAQFDDSVAHRMALLAMRQMGELLCGLGGDRFRLVSNIEDIGHGHEINIWSPSPEDLTGLPEDWRVTSDTIALWLAQAISARGLLLIKAVPPKTPFPVAAELAKNGYLDEYFVDCMSDLELPVYVLGREQIADFRCIIRNPDPQGD